MSHNTSICACAVHVHMYIHMHIINAILNVCAHTQCYIYILIMLDTQMCITFTCYNNESLLYSLISLNIHTKGQS